MRSGWVFLADMGVGVIVGLFLAPQSGTETQQLLGQKVREGADAVRTAAQRAGEQAADIAAKAKEQTW
jgi:gas vesicle protein